jgi:UDP:flavonoid glycosyltransferase YjiC (YdhE family)
MASFLFVSWDGSGNQSPAIGIAQALQICGHTVGFAGYEVQRERLLKQGLPLSVLPRSGAAFSAEPGPAGMFAHTVRHVLASEDHEADLLELLSGGSWNVLVIDCLMFGALAAAEKLAVPAMILHHFAPGTLLASGDFDRLMLPPINHIRHQLGLRMVGDVAAAWRHLPALCATIPELDPLAPFAPADTHYLGPVAERLSASNWQSPWSEADARPLILVSFSSFHAWDQSSRVTRTVAALADQPVRLLITSARCDPSDLGCRENVVLLPYLPHREVMPVVSVVVTHAGHGTVMVALEHGVPLVCLPNGESDQPGLAAQLERLGAGRCLDGEAATTAAIAIAVEQVLHDPSYKIAAQRLADCIAASPRASGAVVLLENLFQRRSIR